MPHPDELTSVNVVRGGLDSFSVIVGPLVAALLVAVADVAAVFVFAGACGLVSAALLVRLDYERIPVPGAATPHLLTEVREGLAAVASNGAWRVVVGLVVLQAAIRGAFSVFVIVVAIDLLDGPESSVGVIQGAVGVGALVGSMLCMLLVGSRAMTRWLGVAVVLWGAPLAMIGLLPSYAVALLAAAVIGIGNALVDVTAFTLLARMVPNAVMARVFGVLESVGAFAVGLGSLAAPLLIGLLGTGPRWWRSVPSPRRCACSGGGGSPRSTGRVAVAPTRSACCARCRCCVRCRCRSSSSSPAGSSRTELAPRRGGLRGGRRRRQLLRRRRRHRARCSTTARSSARWATVRASARSPCSGTPRGP